MSKKATSTISLCIIVRDEEAVLRRCLTSAADLVDEIIIVDTGSVDKTREIALEFTDKVYDFVWVDDFSAARNFAFSKATCDFQMWLDADDVITDEEREKFLQFKKTLDPLMQDVVMMKYNVAFDSDMSPTTSYYRERLLNRCKNFRWEGKIHEVITPTGNIVYEDIAISHMKEQVHDPERNIRILENMMQEGKLSPRDHFYYARELMFHFRYEDAIRSFESFLEDGLGWVENNIQACIDLSNCYRLQGDVMMEKRSLVRSFCYGNPRAEVCCKLGEIFLSESDFHTAITWFKLALSQEPNKTGGFVDLDSYGFTPSINLCVCFDKIGDRQNAVFYHNLSKIYKPHHPSVEYNEKYFGEGIV